MITGAIDQNRFRPVSGQSASYDVMTVCRLAPVKDLRLLLEAMAKIHETRPETRTLIVGDGPERGALETLAGQLGISDRVMFAGTQDDVEEYHRRSRVYVMTSKDEGLSIALAEAMASGLPAVVTDVGELRELVNDGRNGFLVPPCDVDALADRLLRILSADEERELMASRAAEDAFNTCGLPQVALQWDQAVSELVR